MRQRRLLLMAAVISVSCARALPPPGGEQDVLPPRLITTEPAALSVVPPNTNPVVFRFDERLTERNFSEALVTVSPLDSSLRVERSRNEVRVSIDGGWRADRVYRIVLLPGVGDLFGNRREEPAELVFSTGPPVTETAIYGMVLDRITQRPAPRAVVRAARRADSVVYMGVGDAEGFYALRHLPYGVYDVYAFSDQNNNRRRDWLEPVDSGRVVTLGAGADTTGIFFRVLSPDTTPARVTEATVVDSVTLRLRTDDYLEAATALATTTVEVLSLPDSTHYTTAATIVVGTPPPLAPRDTAAAADTAPARPARPQPASNQLTVRLERALAPGNYVVRVRGLVNISGLPGGGGTEDFEVRAPATPAPVQRDTLQVGRRR